MTDNDLERYLKRQKELIAMLKRELGPDVGWNETRPISSASDDWEMIVKIKGKKEKLLFSSELMTDENNAYEKEFKNRIARLKRSLQ
jgi:hypothetical protein